jgi:hypothetical protein
VIFLRGQCLWVSLSDRSLIVFYVIRSRYRIFSIWCKKITAGNLHARGFQVPPAWFILVSLVDLCVVRFCFRRLGCSKSKKLSLCFGVIPVRPYETAPFFTRWIKMLPYPVCVWLNPVWFCFVVYRFQRILASSADDSRYRIYVIFLGSHSEVRDRLIVRSQAHLSTMWVWF